MIKAFKFRAQAISSLLEDTPPWFTKFEFENFFLLFYIISTICEIKSNFKSVQFFCIHPVDSMDIVVRPPEAVGKSKVVCGHCHHKGHRNQDTNPCRLTKCTDYTYCGVKEKHPEYFQKLNAMKMELSKRKAAFQARVSITL